MGMKPRCRDCVYVDLFKPRNDERARGLLMGCRKPGWESYTHDDNPSCGGVFFAPSEQAIEAIRENAGGDP